MKKSVYVLVSLSCCFMLFLPSVSDAHPGRTDSNGGHTCRTNCEKWGLEYGEYHYHNDGDTSNSGSSNNSDTDTNNTDSSTESNSDSSNDTNSSTKSKSESESSSPKNNENETPAETKPKPEPKPKVDKKQLKADQHYEEARDYYNDDKYKEALEELDKIYDLKRNDDKTDQLVSDTFAALYIKAESNLKKERYEDARELLEIILDYKHMDSKMEKKANKLLDKVELQEKISDLLGEAKSAIDNQEYEEALSIIEEANELKETKEATSLFKTTLDDILNNAESNYNDNEFEKAKEYYNILHEHTESTKIKEEYQIIIDQIEEILFLQTEYKLDTIDINDNSLFITLINDKEKETNYNVDVVKQVSTFLTENNGEKDIKFIFNTDIKELSTGGHKDEN